MATYDALAEVKQSLAEKVVRSVDYPFTAIEKTKDYDGFILDEGADYQYSDKEAEKLVSQMSSDINTSTNTSKLEDISASFATEVNEIEENIKNCLGAYQEVIDHNNSNPKKKIVWTGPSKQELHKALKSIKNVAGNTSKSASLGGDLSTLGIKFDAILSWIRVRVLSEPKFSLSNKEFALNSLKLDVAGTGEVWMKYKWLKCIKKKWGICYKWKWVWKKKRMLSVTLKGIRFKISASAIPKIVKNTLVKVYAVVKKFRLDHKYLDKIPLEKLANKTIGKKPVTAFDVGKFKSTLPLLQSDAKISKVSLPPSTKGISVAMSFDIT